MMAAKRSTWNMPRLLMVKEPPVNSCGVSLFARARPASSRTCAARQGRPRQVATTTCWVSRPGTASQAPDGHCGPAIICRHQCLLFPVTL